MFYPMIEQGRFLNLREVAETAGVGVEHLQRALENATIEGSQLAICEGVALGDPLRRVYAVLQSHADASITLWAGLFAEAQDDRAGVQAWLADTEDAFADRTVAIGEFTPRGVGNA